MTEAPANPSPPKLLEHNRTGIDFRQSMPRPKACGIIIDGHTHLLAARHAKLWFDAGKHYGIDAYISQTPLEEAIAVQRDWGDRVHFVSIPAWGDQSPNWMDNWLRRLEAFYNLGSRIVKFHMAPGTGWARGLRLDSDQMRPILREVADRKMIFMSHVGDPELWYVGKYAKDPDQFGTREQHYRMWENVLTEFRDHPWLGAHMGGNPEDLARMQRMLDTYPNLSIDSSATKWVVREISQRRDEAREFFIRNQDRILFGSDQVSTDDRGWDFLASRFWCHRKMWDTAYIGQTPIHDPELPEDNQPILRGLALPDEVLQKIYHDNATNLLGRVGAGFGWG